MSWQDVHSAADIPRIPRTEATLDSMPGDVLEALSKAAMSEAGRLDLVTAGDDTKERLVGTALFQVAWEIFLTANADSSQTEVIA